jgi:hypothetical protein
MSNILGMSGIQPNNRYTAEDIWNAVQKSLEKNPTVQCIVDPVSIKTGIYSFVV